MILSILRDVKSNVTIFKARKYATLLFFGKSKYGKLKMKLVKNENLINPYSRFYLDLH